MCLLRTFDATRGASFALIERYNAPPPKHKRLNNKFRRRGLIAHPGSDAVPTETGSKAQARGAHGEVGYRVKGEAHQLRNGCKQCEDEDLELWSGGQTSANIQTQRETERVISIS